MSPTGSAGDEPVEILAADVEETVVLDDDGTVVDVVESDVLVARRDDDGDVLEVVETHVVDTEVIGPDGEVLEVVETEVLDARVDGDDVVVTGTVDVELVASEVVDVDDADDEAEDTISVDTEQLDDGSSAVGAAEAIVGGPEALPFEMPARERFAALDDVAVTGDARVDAATARLDEVPDLPTNDHVGVYEDVHRRLQDALSDTEVR